MMNKWTFVLVVGCLCLQAIVVEGGCPCAHASECAPIATKYSKEAFGYVLKSDHQIWNNFDWSKLTTIALVDFYDVQIVCLAHRHQVRVVTRESFNLALINNQSASNKWVEDKVGFASKNYLDGISLYIDDAVGRGSKQVSELTQFVKQVTESFHRKIPSSKVVFNLPWSPHQLHNINEGVDNKNYDIVSISSIVDLLFVMNYEQLSQSEEPCLSGGNTGFFYTLGALLAYKEAKVDLNKMIVGFPYYGHDYQCLSSEPTICYTKTFQYRGFNCSSHVATIVTYDQWYEYVKKLPSYTHYYDEHSDSHYYSYKSGDGTMNQLWYDGWASLNNKFNLALQNNVHGIGMWTLNYMDHGAWANLPSVRH